MSDILFFNSQVWSCKFLWNKFVNLNCFNLTKDSCLCSLVVEHSSNPNILFVDKFINITLWFTIKRYKLLCARNIQTLLFSVAKIQLGFSLNWPAGPIQSLSCNARQSCVCGIAKKPASRCTGDFWSKSILLILENF